MPARSAARPAAAPETVGAAGQVSLLAVHQGGGVGGAPVSLLKLLAGLDASRFHARAVFSEAGPVVDYASDLGVAAEVVPTGGAFFYSAHARLGVRMLARFLRSFPGSVRRAQVELRRRRPDVLHLNTSVLLAWGAAARREGVPVVWMVRETLGPNPAVRRWHARYIQRHARQVVAVSDTVRACFPSDAGVRRVSNAVDLDEFRLSLLDERAAIRAELGLALDDRAVVVVGSVQRVKGHWLALDALALLAPADPGVRLVLVCGGVPPSYAATTRGRVKRLLGLPLDSLEALRRDAAARGLDGRLLVTGYRRDVARVLAAADVVLFPSLAPEGAPRAILEAMAMARPVVATDIGPSRELLGDASGALVSPTPGAAADALRTLLKSPTVAATLGRAGRARVEERFTLDRQVAAMEAMYAEVARGA